MKPHRSVIRRLVPTFIIPALVSAGLGWATSASAETRTLQGEQLVLTTSLSSRVVIDTDASLSGQLRVSADQPLSCLSVREGQTAIVGTSGCDSDLESLRITVSPNMPVTVTARGDGSVQVADLGAPLTVTLTSSADLKAGHVGSLAISMSGDGDAVVGAVDGPASAEMNGSGNLRLGALTGPLSLRHTGSGDLTVGVVTAPSVAIESVGSGDMVIGGGNITSLNARLRGSGDLSVAATVGDGNVSASGGGDVKLGQVTGKLNRSSSGSSTITAGGVSTGELSDRSSRSAVVVRSSHVFGHVVAAVLAVVMLFFVWRIVRRARSSRSAARNPGVSTHPGVVAVGELLTRLDQRLGRVESYVTTREFDLNRKFRDLK